MNSVNQSVAVSDKFRDRYGDTWANMDFYPAKLNLRVFRMSPMDYIVGRLKIAGKSIEMSYKNLLSYETKISTMIDVVYTDKYSDSWEVQISGIKFDLQKHEFTKLFETLRDAKITIQRKYQLGL